MRGVCSKNTLPVIGYLLPGMLSLLFSHCDTFHSRPMLDLVFLQGKSAYFYFSAPRNRRAQRLPCGGGDFPGVLCLGASHYSHADGKLLLLPL